MKSLFVIVNLHSLACVRLARALALFAFVFVTTAASVARADFPLFDTDKKTFPATMCRPTVGTAGTIKYETDGTVSNSSGTEALHLVCPFVRDATLTDLEEDFSVYVVDRHPTQDIKCTVSAHEPFGDIVPDQGLAYVKSSSGSASGTQKLSLTTEHQATEGYSVLNCGIPPTSSSGLRSRINVYVFEELFVNGEASTDSKAYTGVFGEQWVFTLGAQPGFEYEEIGAATRPPGEEALASWRLPLLRDVVASDWNRVRIRAFDDDGAPDADFLCNVYAYTEEGEVDGELSGFCTQDQTLGETTIECVPFLPGVSPTTDDGPYVIECLSVPQESTVFMYDLREE